MDLTNESILHIKTGKFDLLKFKRLLDFEEIEHAFTLKPLNYRNRKGMCDDYKELFDLLELDYKTLVKPSQSHTDNILIFDSKENRDDADINLDYLKDIDAIITNKSNITLATTSADCLCILLYDKVNGVIGNIHSGWRGTTKKILSKSLDIMIKNFGSNPENILAFLFPAIRSCCFEVDEDVEQIFEDIFGKNESFIKLGRFIDGKQKYNIDNILINKIMLKEKGILTENIFDSRICSFCNSSNIHSRRADGENFGLGTTVIMKK